MWNPNSGMTNPGMAGGQLPNGADPGPYPPNGMPRYYGALPPMYQLQQRFIPAPAPGSSWRPNTANPATSLPPQRQPSAYLAENRSTSSPCVSSPECWSCRVVRDLMPRCDACVDR
jgi:hypothetical protein